MAAAACTSVLASAGPDHAHELHGRFHDATLKQRQNTNNLLTFTGALGGIKADAVSGPGMVAIMTLCGLDSIKQVGRSATSLSAGVGTGGFLPLENRRI